MYLPRMHLIAPSIFLAMVLQGCSGNDDVHVVEPPPESQYPTVSVLEVGESPIASVSCSELFALQCEVRWSGNDTWDDAIIFRSTVDDFATAAEVGRKWSAWFGFTDRDVEAGTRYYYWVLFEDKSGQRSPVSESASVCPISFDAGVFSCVAPTDPTVGVDPGQDPEDLEPEVIVQRLPFPRGASTEHHQVVKQPLLATEVQQAPVYHDGAHLFVGIDQGTEAMADMKSAGESQSSSIETVVTPTGSYRTSVTKTTKTTISERGEWSVRHGYFDERQGRGGTAEMLSGYLRESAQLQRLGMPVVMRFTAPAAVHFGGIATAADANLLKRAVQLVNTALPLEWRLRMPRGIPIPAPLPETQEGIYVEFMPRSEYDSEEPTSLGYAETAWLPDGSIPYATIKINKAYRGGGERQAYRRAGA